MALVTAHMSLSLDGFYAGPKHADTDDWMESPEAAAFFRITKWVVGAMAWRERHGYEGGERSTNSDILQDMFESAAACVMGRRMVDGGEEPWGEEPPFHAPVFVVGRTSGREGPLVVDHPAAGGVSQRQPSGMQAAADPPAEDRR